MICTNKTALIVAAMTVISIVCVPTASGAVDRDKLIDDLMVVSGTKESMSHMTDQVIQGAMNTAGGQGGTAKIMSDAFPPGGFVDGITLALEQNYDEARYTRLVKLLSSPLAKQMTEIEKQKPSNVAIQQFLTQVAKQPLSPERITLLRRFDELSGTSKMVSEIAFSTMEAIAIAVTSDCPGVKADVRKKLTEKRNDIAKSQQSSVLVLLAFTYRDVSDKDFSSYSDMLKDKDAIWFQGILQSAILKQFNEGSKVMAEGLTKIAMAKKASQSMFTPQCGDKPDMFSRKPSKADAMSVKQQDISMPTSTFHQTVSNDHATHLSSDEVGQPVGSMATKAVRSASLQENKSKQKLSGDARNCLNLSSDQKIIACADKFH